jgi:hypothetical protein
MEGTERMKKDEEAGAKPFYENIASKKKRVHDHPPKPGAKPGAKGDSRSSSGDRAPRDSRPHTGDGRPRRDDRPHSGDDRAPRDSRPRVGDGRPRRDDRSHSGDDRAPRDGRPRVGDGRPRADSPRAPGSRDAAPYAAPRAAAPRARKPFDAPVEGTPVFGTLAEETRSLLEAFPDIVQGVFPLDSKKLQLLPGQIRELSHELTDERSDRRVGYLNDPAELSAYIRYYMWWNLVRLTKLFSALPVELSDGDAAVDLGSGPLTLPIALWMARPDLRKKNISWYCVDISAGALSAGEDLFLSLAARTGDEPWKITRVRGEAGVSLKRSVALVASANMFNELFWDNPLPLEAQAKHHAEGLVSYASPSASILVVEPGIPRAGRFVSLLRDSLMRVGFSPVSPCPHEGECPLPGLRHGKWCHFVFDASDAPAKLQKLSDDAGLPKDRAALSFIFSKRASVATTVTATESTDADGAALPENTAETLAPTERVRRLSDMFHGLRVRVASDPIRLPEFMSGRYGCSELGMVLVEGDYQASDYLRERCDSGKLIEVPMPETRRAARDPKTDAIIVRLENPGSKRDAKTGRATEGDRPPPKRRLPPRDRS